MNHETKRALARVLELPFVGSSIGWVLNERIRSRGLTIETSGLAPKIKSQLFFGTYEAAEIRAVQRHLRPDLDVIELGASIGVLTCHIRRKVAAGARLYAVEASAEAAAMISRNLRHNGLQDNVTVLNAALTADSAPVQFDPGSTNIAGRVCDGPANAQGIAVRPVTLAELVAELGFVEYSMVCDIEGSEVGVLSSESAALARCAQMIIELHPAKFRNRLYTVDDLVGILQTAYGYRLRSRYGNVCVFDRK